MSNRSGSPGKDSGPQKIALPDRGVTGNSSPEKSEKKKPGWLLPIGLILFLIVGFALIFQLRPTEKKAETVESVAQEKPDEPDTAPATKQSPTVLTPEELVALKEQATQAVADQADIERPHKFQNVLFGKAASYLTDADTAFAQEKFSNAQIGYESVLDTIDSLTESYLVADEISRTKETIESLEITLMERAASLVQTDRYKSVELLKFESEELLQSGEFKDALDKLKACESSLNLLVEEGEKQFQTALQEGLKALNSGDGETAKMHLEIAQGLRPNDSFITRQLERAEVIDRVFAHYNQGLAFEQQGQLGSARVEYQKAIELDPDSVNINSRLQAINQTLNQELFDETLVAGLTALADGNGDAAVDLLQRATSLMPADAKARSALEDAKELQRRQTVDRLLAQGEAALAESDWDAARTAFREVLDYEPNSNDAQIGLANAEEQIARERQLRKLLVEAEAFEKNGEFEKALIVLREGRQFADPSGAVTEKIQHLERILEEQSQPQKVRILSDNQTEIEILKIGKYNPANELELELRPGNYTIVGSRLMYRDVRYDIVVEVGVTPAPIEVICQEKL